MYPFDPAEHPPTDVNRAVTTHDPKLVLAYAIAEWDSAITALDALHRMVITTPTHYPVLEQMRWELNWWQIEWQKRGYLENQAWTGNLSDWIINEARAYLTTHQTELDQLLSERG